MAFLNPPHAALLLAPFAWLDFATAFRLWTALQLALVVLIARTTATVVRATAPLDRWTVFTAVGAFWPLFYAVQIGQLSLVLLLALLRLFLTLEEEADEKVDARAGAWLFVLSLKPQLLPLLLMVLVAMGRARALAWALLFAVTAVVLSSIVLGFAVWGSYVRGLVHLERFFAQGTPEHMVSLRGLLSLLFGPSTTTAYLSVGALVAVAFAAAAAWRRHPVRSDAPAALAHRFAATVALTLFFCPHLFVQDVTLWIAPLAIFHRSVINAPTRASFARFALAWPLLFLVVAAIAGATGSSVMPLALAPITVALTWLVRADHWSAAEAQ